MNANAYLILLGVSPSSSIAWRAPSTCGFSAGKTSHRNTNVALEGLNNRIAGLVQKAFGFRNRERFKTNILFHLGALDRYRSQ